MARAGRTPRAGTKKRDEEQKEQESAQKKANGFLRHFDSVPASSAKLQSVQIQKVTTTRISREGLTSG